MDICEEIVTLVRTVASLPREDQNRILRLVDLMSLAPFSAQQRAQKMLRELLDAQPGTHLECGAHVDEIIEHLEEAVRGRAEPGSRWTAVRPPLARGHSQ